MGSTANVLEGAKKALDNANKFTSNVTGGKPSAFALKPEVKAQPERTDYSHARAARTSLGSEVESAAAGLKSKQQNVDQYVKSTQ